MNKLSILFFILNSIVFAQCDSSHQSSHGQTLNRAERFSAKIDMRIVDSASLLTDHGGKLNIYLVWQGRTKSFTACVATPSGMIDTFRIEESTGNFDTIIYLSRDTSFCSSIIPINTNLYAFSIKSWNEQSTYLLIISEYNVKLGSYVQDSTSRKTVVRSNYNPVYNLDQRQIIFLNFRRNETSFNKIYGFNDGVCTYLKSIRIKDPLLKKIETSPPCVYSIYEPLF